MCYMPECGRVQIWVKPHYTVQPRARHPLQFPNLSSRQYLLWSTSTYDERQDVVIQWRCLHRPAKRAQPSRQEGVALFYHREGHPTKHLSNGWVGWAEVPQAKRYGTSKN